MQTSLLYKISEAYHDDKVWFFTLLFLGLCFVAVIGLIVWVVLIAILGGNTIPTEHLGGQCQDYYTAVVIKGITYYDPVHVCP